MGFVVGTLLMWGLSAFLVAPLSKALMAHRLAQPAYAHLGGADLPAQDHDRLQRMARTSHLVASIGALALAGFIGGLCGYFFIGFSRRAIDWPGMIAFMVLSFVGYAMGGGFGRL